jgi:uncharacterized repeat protein (TIGR02543 family)
MLRKFLQTIKHANVARLTVAAILLGSLQFVAVAVPSISKAVDSGSISFVREGTGAAPTNNQYLNIPASSNYKFDGDFTIEAWVKFSTLDSFQAFLGQYIGGGWSLQMNSTGLRFSGNLGSSYKELNSNKVFVTGTWYHIAFVRNGTDLKNIKIYVDGILTTDADLGVARNDALGNATQINTVGGGTAAGNDRFNGKISNIRYVKRAIYTRNFVPSTSPLTAISDTVLLLNTTNDGNYLKDNSVNNVTITARNGASTTTGLPVADAEAPIYSPRSICFNGSQVRYFNIEAIGTSDFTLELWVKPASYSYYSRFLDLDQGNNGSYLGYNKDIVNNLVFYPDVTNAASVNSVPVGVWSHVALVRSSSTLKMYINGQEVKSSDNSKNYLATKVYLGSMWNGSNSNNNFVGCMTSVRIAKSALYSSNFTPAVQGTFSSVPDATNVLVALTANNDSMSNLGAAGSIQGTGNITYEAFAKLSQTITFASLGNKSFGISPFALNAIATSGLGVTFTASPSGTCTVSGSSLTLVGAGTCSVTATQAGNDSYEAANPISQSFTVFLNQSEFTLNSATGTYGSTTTLGTTGGSGSGSATYAVALGNCTVSGNILSNSSAGDCSVTATKAGDGTYDSITSTAITVTIAKATQTITATSSSLSIQYGSTATLGSSGSSGTGSKTYSVDSGNCSITGTTLTSTGIGNCIVKVTIATDANYLAATSSSITISMAERPVTITAANKTAIYSGSSVTVSNTFTISSGTLVVSNDITGATYTYTSVGGYNSTTAPTIAGVYSITPSAAVFATENATNYSVSYTAGTLTISSVPVLTATSASSITSTSASINFTSSSTGNYYLLVYAAATTAPTAAEVIAQGTAIKKASASVLASANSASITGLTVSTEYKAYIVIKDALNLNSTVSTVSFTTLMTAPNAPGFRSARVKVIADNDYAVYMGSDLEITRILHQSNVDWPSQVANIGTLDVFPLAGETYMYVLAMGGNGSYLAPGAGAGGEEDWTGTINGRSVFEFPGAQVAVNRAVADPLKTDILHSGYLLLNNYLPNYAASSGSVEAGTYSVDSATANASIKDVVWGPATLTEALNGTLPYKTSCSVSCRVIDTGVTVRGWDFPDRSAVIFRYPLSNAQLPVTAGDKQVVVDWDASDGGGTVAKYLVDYKESSEPDGAYKSFSEVAAATTIETVTGLTNGTSYTFRVTAVNAGGTASSVSRAVTPTGAPSQPLNLSYAAGAGYVDVSFTAPENNGGFSITNYSYSIDNGANWVTRSPQSTTSPVRISGLTDGTTYQIKLKAINPSGAGLASTVIAAKAGITVNRTVSYVSGTLATITGLPTGGTYVAGDTFRIASGPTRTNFTFTGWKDGATSYQPGDTFTVGASNSTLTAQWVQDSLLGTAAGDRSRVLTWNIVSGTGVDATVSGGADNSVRVQIPADALAAGTEVIFWRLLNDNVAKSKINNSNSYIVNLAVSWSIGDDVTVAKTVQTAAFPVTLTVTNGSIKAGATAWQIIGDNVRVIGTASQDGVLNLSFTEDPVIAAANVANPPVFGATTSTADGFTVSITNYDAAYVWENPTVSTGNVAITSTAGSTRLLTVTGLTIGQSATISQSNSLSGVANSSRTTTVTGSATAGAALNPVFGAATATADGFTVSITNYDSSYTWATPTVSSGTVTVTSTSGTNRLLTVTGLSSGGSATITQTTSRAGYSSGSRTATGTAITATPVVVQQPVMPAPVEPAPVIQGPPPSTLKITSRPKISRDLESLFCQAGKFLFLREGRVEEPAKLSIQVFSLLQNGKVIDSSKSTNEKVAFAIKPSYLDTTLSCQIDVEQENLTVSGQSLDFELMSKIAKSKNLAITSADQKYYSDREAAYAKKAQSFAELAKTKDVALAAAKSSKEIVTARITYQKAYTAASNLWKKELADAASNRVLAKELAQKQYLDALEAAGISIYPIAEKSVVTPTPTPAVKPTPTPSPTASNVQPTAEMKKVGTVYMATGSYVLNASTKITLKALALQINAQQIKQVLVYGHTDSRGGVNNTVLSQNRAKAVANYLRPLLKGKKIVIGWYASRKPAATGTTASDLAKNRRVEVYTK